MMRRLSGLGLCLISLLAGCGQAGPQWEEWKSPRGDFSVSLPGVPTETVEQISAGGTTVQQHTFRLELPASTKQQSIYRILYVDLPPGTMAATGPRAMLQTSLEGALEETQAEVAAGTATKHTVDYQRATTYLGRPAIEWRLRYALNGNTFLTTNRNFINGERLYMLTMIREEKLDTQDEAARFFDSFKVLR